MKSLTAVISAFLANQTSRYNLIALVKLVGGLVVLITVYSVLFHVLMEREGQHHSWVTGFYWTLTVMSTLGFGDITFESDMGRVFSIIVLSTGVVYLLILLPFTFIEFFYAPWMKAQEAVKAPQEVPPGTNGHVILTGYDPVPRMLIRMLDEYRYPYFVLVPTVQEALELREHGIRVVKGDRSDPDTYRRLAIDRAAMVVTTLDDVSNTNVTFTVRELSESVPIVASVNSSSVCDALELAGATHLLSLEQMMGEALARRVIGHDAAGHVIGDLDGLIIAEASPAKTELVGRTIAESNLRAETGVTVVGLWERGRFMPSEPGSRITQHSVLLFAGTREQIDRYNAIHGRPDDEPQQVVIVGGGRVGRATARALTEAGIEWTLIEKNPDRVRGLDHTIIGDASKFDVLVKAGMHDAGTIIVTTHDDDINIFLTIFCRRLRQNMQIISRCTEEKTAERLHRAGADLVLSYASMGANTIFNHLRGSDTVLLAEGVNIFTVGVPRSLAGKSLARSAVRSRTGCSIIAVETAGERIINPGPDQELPADGNLVLIGSLEAERQFLAVYKPA